MGPMKRLKVAQGVGLVGGAWLMGAPAALSYAGRPAGALHRIVGPLLFSIALISCSRVAMGLRWANVLLGAVLALAPVVVAHSFAAGISGILVGLAVAAAAPFGSEVRDGLGGGWRSVWKARAGSAQDGICGG